MDVEKMGDERRADASIETLVNAMLMKSRAKDKSERCVAYAHEIKRLKRAYESHQNKKSGARVKHNVLVYGAMSLMRKGFSVHSQKIASADAFLNDTRNMPHSQHVEKETSNMFRRKNEALGHDWFQSTLKAFHASIPPALLFRDNVDVMRELSAAKAKGMQRRVRRGRPSLVGRLVTLSWRGRDP